MFQVTPELNLFLDHRPPSMSTLPASNCDDRWDASTLAQEPEFRKSFLVPKATKLSTKPSQSPRRPANHHQTLPPCVQTDRDGTVRISEGKPSPTPNPQAPQLTTISLTTIPKRVPSVSLEAFAEASPTTIPVKPTFSLSSKQTSETYLKPTPMRDLKMPTSSIAGPDRSRATSAQPRIPETLTFPTPVATDHSN
ncbi:hypothetical protein FOXG_19960 [Fusarium oxysporum f. sp. lycopersici 4287]|uniref:Uncharacterized protein n=2 Tax=Fusarium oxysporum TaxID=5507 RepID=A0A0J9VAK0_FUSO4|nr:hypothetical protein FOXG_19960 [Fusarium oxysporum f. sp. lycopersici 4287]XP_018246010.1 hypothetical protein FOXG_19960 [Fusarium oxysporum f. sp. lycopersici 4287]XP_018246011.1 hypothetical protein FOXG_19960 [Fusarium oxysporum f. sp. lycopersici 4287]XP_018246012.1 hypothetical protein FOXG_19960 [Fusarium oxysporum f. sp. lycopersici 4287]EXK36878.1 hypothetical protein FOMG_07770 [Fusarium oxysporum f. sp. melonis 26406]EXK36879.1 hypothetical protein FOMG_07770 [Fusarium oxysporum